MIKPDTTLRLLVFGIDGASVDVVEQLMAEGRLPTLRRLADSGSLGTLVSTFPPHTAPGWASMFTGAAPGEHGILQFWRTRQPAYQAVTVNATQYGREPLWRRLERHGLRCGVYNVPMTHPPQALRGGYMISWPLSPTVHYSEPPSVVAELAKAGLHHHSDLVTMYRGQSDYLQQAEKFVAGRTESAIHLQRTRPVDALFLVHTEVDRVSHHYWGDGARPAEPVLTAYEWMDRSLARLLDLTDENTVVVVASDHGFGPCRYDIDVHAVLERAGLLSVAYRRDESEGGQRARPDDVSAASWFTSPHLYRREVDWLGTAAYMPTPGCFGINLNLAGREVHGCVTDLQRPTIEARLRTAIESIVDDDGTALFTLRPAAEVYSGERVDDAPDFLMIPARWDVMPVPGTDGIVRLPPAQQGVHRPEGVLAVRGGTVPAGSRLLARIEDVTPFILAQLGLPVPERMDGHWLFTPSAPLTREPDHRGGESAIRHLTQEEERLMNLQLSALGYL